MRRRLLPVALAIVFAVPVLAQTQGIRTDSQRLGSPRFNLLILPKEPAATLPEEYAGRVAKLRLMSMERVQPILQQDLNWPEEGRGIRLIGIRGELPSRGGDPKAALDPVPVGAVALGYELYHAAGRKVGDQVELLGRKFTIARCEPARNNQDEDNTAWVHLKEAQELLQQKGRINGIVVSNGQAPSDRLGQLRAEVAELLPETRVIEFGTETLARAEARDRETAPEIHGSWKMAGTVLVWLVVGGGSVWLGFLAIHRLRKRLKSSNSPRS